MDSDDDLYTSSWSNFPRKRDTTLKYDQDLTGVENATPRNMTQVRISLGIDDGEREKWERAREDWFRNHPDLVFSSLRTYVDQQKSAQLEQHLFEQFGGRFDLDDKNTHDLFRNSLHTFVKRTNGNKKRQKGRKQSNPSSPIQNISPHGAMRSIPDEDVSLVAQFQPPNGPRLVCTASDILREDETPGTKSSVASRVSFKKWHDGLVMDMKDTACTADFDITCQVGGLPLRITSDRQLKVALTGCGNGMQPKTEFVLTRVERKRGMFQCLLYAKIY